MVVSASCQQQQREKLLQQTANAIASASVKMEVEGDEGEDHEEEEGESEVKVEVKAEPCDDDDSGDEEEDGVDEVNSKGSFYCYPTRRRPKVENFFHIHEVYKNVILFQAEGSYVTDSDSTERKR